MLKEIKILKSHGIQYVKDLRTQKVAERFRGRPVIANDITDEEKRQAAAICPTGAIDPAKGCIDLGRCVFCNECALALPDKIRFTNDYRIAANRREDLIIRPGADQPVRLAEHEIRPEIRNLFHGSLKLRQVSAGGDNSGEMELNAAGNVNFDMGRYGIEFVASPRHADGIVITGPVSKNMATALQMTYDAVPDPKMIILVGTDAISGGIFADSPAVDRSFPESHRIDLYVPGNPAHPLTFINGLMDLLGL
ncbi:MAG: NADH:ubiquinone oxidoreductase [Bacteroidales bacterium]|jgi:Ni,Fe-hydrogenase III small subunit|nr:NADH:ubiquinone oxidoreductase [Bacteroidales bacterium]